MRNVEFQLHDEGEFTGWPAGAQCADWKEDPEDVLKAVDAQLKEHGLEVVLFETNSDTYVWSIERREPKPGGAQ